MFVLDEPSASRLRQATPRAEQSLMDMGRYLLRFAGDKKAGSAVQSEAESLQTLCQAEVDNSKVLY